MIKIQSNILRISKLGIALQVKFLITLSVLGCHVVKTLFALIAGCIRSHFLDRRFTVLNCNFLNAKLIRMVIKVQAEFLALFLAIRACLVADFDLVSVIGSNPNFKVIILGTELRSLWVDQIETL